jgi:hypothetical protein
MLDMGGHVQAQAFQHGAVHGFSNHKAMKRRYWANAGRVLCLDRDSPNAAAPVQAKGACVRSGAIIVGSM